MKSYGSESPKTYLAYAHGAACPATLGEPGFSASGCNIEDLAQRQLSKTIIHVSRLPNRRAWEAGIMAVVAVLEAANADSDVEVRLNNQTLVNSINNDFVNSDGKPAKGSEFWLKLIELKKAKNIKLTAALAPKRDSRMCILRDETSNAAEAAMRNLLADE